MDMEKDNIRLERHRKRVAAEKKAYIILAVLIVVILGLAGTGIGLVMKNRPEKAPEPIVQATTSEPLITPSPSPLIPVEPSEEPLPSEEPRDDLDDLVDLYMASMSLEDKVYGLFIITPEALTGVNTATRAGNSTKEAIEKKPVGGIVYFAKNITGRTQFKEMLLNTQKYAKYPMFIALDEEGGSVARLGNSSVGVSKVEDMSSIGASNDNMNAYMAYATIATYLNDFGVNLNFAPVSDVLSDNTNASLKKRVFGSDPEMDARMVASSVKALQEQGISATLKHFPGMGDVSGDTHSEVASSSKTLGELNECDLIPFKAGIEVGVDFIMVGHASYPNVTGDNTIASMSPYIITDLLREALEYKGVIITDALNMSAVTTQYSSGEAAVLTLKAGADMILMPQNFDEAYNAVLEAVRSGELSEERIDESIHRIYRVKYKDAIGGAVG